MSKDDQSIDELTEQIQQLSTDDRSDLFDGLREDQLQSYLGARGEYVDRLRDEGLIPRFPEDSPWSGYCEEHPYDPICQRIVGREQMREDFDKYQRARGAFVDRLREQGLLSDDQQGGMMPTSYQGGMMPTSYQGGEMIPGDIRQGDVMGLPDEVGYTPRPDDYTTWPRIPPICELYPWLCGPPPICERYPWLCGPWPPWPPEPRPDPNPFEMGEHSGGQWGRYSGGQGSGYSSGQVGGYSGGPSPSYSGMNALSMEGNDPRFDAGMGSRFRGEVDIQPGGPGVPRIDICKYFPRLPQCWPPCPSFCQWKPWHPICRWCR